MATIRERLLREARDSGTPLTKAQYRKALQLEARTRGLKATDSTEELERLIDDNIKNGEKKKPQAKKAPPKACAGWIVYTSDSYGELNNFETDVTVYHSLSDAIKYAGLLDRRTVQHRALGVGGR